MSSSRGGVTERSLSRVRLYDPVRVAQPVVSSFFNASLALCMRAPVRARDFIHGRGRAGRRICGRLRTARTHTIDTNTHNYINHAIVSSLVNNTTRRGKICRAQMHIMYLQPSANSSFSTVGRYLAHLWTGGQTDVSFQRDADERETEKRGAI